MTIKGTKGNDVLTGTAGNDVFILNQGGNDHVSGGGGNDIFKFGGAFTAKDIVDGGSGINTLSLAGDYTGDHRVIFHPATLTNIQNIVLGAHHSYSMASNDAAVAAGATLTIDASRLQAGDTFRFNAKHDHDGAFNLIGGAGNDVLGGASQADTFDISHGGDDLVRSGSGDDIIHAGAQFTAADTIDAGAGNDTLVLDGDYSAGLTLGANTIAKVETLSLAAGNNYSLTTNDANVSNGGTLAVDASALGAGNSLHFDGSAETNGSFAITGGAGDDTVTLSSSAVLAASTFDGGAGDDTVNLAGDFSGGASAHLSGVETIVLASADTYNLIVNDDGTLDGNKLTIDASALGSADNVDIGAATVTADIHFIDGAGQNILDSGTGNDTFDLTQGHYDSVHGGDGDDVFNFAANFGGFSYVHGDAGNDTVNFDGDYASLAIDNSANLFEGIETIAFGGGHAYNNVTVTGDVSGGALTLDASAASSISIDLSNATSSAVNFTGSAGDDSVTVADQNLLAASTFDGGAGNDTLVLDGDYSAGLTLGANTIANVETLSLATGHDYSLTTNDANVSSGGTLAVDASALGAGNSLHFDGSAETNGSFAVTGGAGDDTVTLGSSTALAASTLDGGAGNDTLVLDGDYSAGVTLGANTIANVETLNLAAGHDYSLTTNDANVSSGGTLAVDASALGAGNSLHFDGSAETNGSFAVTGGAGDDTVTLGSSTVLAASTFDGGAGNDTLVLDANLGNIGTRVPFTFGANMLTSIETLELTGSFSYDLKSVDANVAAGETLTFDASTLAGLTGKLEFNGSAETDGNFHLIMGSGTLGVEFIAGGGDDLFDLTAATQGGIFDGRGGNDTFEFASTFIPLSIIVGGSGNDTLSFSGNYTSLALKNDQANGYGTSQIETAVFGGGHSYTGVSVSNDLTANSGSGVAGGNTLTLDASDSSLFRVDLSAAYSAGYAITAGDGDDSFKFAGNLHSTDIIDGGAGNDTVELNGDYSGGFTFGATTMTNVETLKLDAGHSYTITSGDATVANGATLTVNASALGASDSLNFDGSAETNGNFAITGGAGGDTVTFGNASVLAASTFDGGAGHDTLILNGDFSGGFTFQSGTIASVENLNFAGGHDYSITMDDNIATGGILVVDSQSLAAGDSLTFDGSAETDGRFTFLAGNGLESLKGGTQADGFAIDTDNPYNVNDTFDGGAGFDTFYLLSLSNYTFSFGADTIHNIERVMLTASAPSAAHLVMSDGSVAAGQTLTVDAGTLDATSSLNLDASAETNGGFAITGGAGDDTVTFSSSTVLAASTFDGGAGSDTLVLDGNFNVNFSAGTIVNVETIEMAAGHSYTLNLADGNIAAAHPLTVDGSALASPNGFTLSAAAETDGALDVIGGAGDDTLLLDDANTLSQSDFHGGGGDDRLSLNGDFSSGVILGANYSGIEAIQATGGHDYNFTLMDNLVAAGATLEIDGGSISSGHSLNVDGADETDGIFHMTGGAGDDSLTGGAQGDLFDLSQGGHDTVSGGGGDDAIISLGTGFDAGDKVDGGSGFDSVALLGDYSGGLTLGAATMTNIEEISFQGAFNYALTTNDATVAAGQTLYVGEFILPAAQSLTFDGSAETDGHFFADLGAAQCDITGGAISDSFQANAGGSNGFNTADAINGGAGNDSLSLSVQEATSLTFTDATIQSVETLILSSSGTSPLSLTMADGNVAAGTTLSVFGIPMSSSSALTFDGSAETDGSYAISGGAGNDSLTGGALADTLSGGGGADMFVYANAGHSSGNTYDTITDLNFSEGDQFNLLGGLNAPSAIDAAVNGGALSGGAGFDTDLAAAVGAGQLGANHAVTFTADSGSLANHTFLVIDENGTAGYQSGADIVIDITGYTGTLSTSAFLS